MAATQAGAAAPATAVSFQPGSTLASAVSTWNVGFTPTSALTSTDTLTLTFPSAFALPTTASSYTVADTTASHTGTFAVTGVSYTTGTDVITLGTFTPATGSATSTTAGDALKVTIVGVTNPPTTGTNAASAFSVTDSVDVTAGNTPAVSPAYGVTISTSRTATFTPGSLTAGNSSTWTVDFTSGAGAPLASGSTVTVTLPSAFTDGATPSASVTDTTANGGTFGSSTASFSGGVATITVGTYGGAPGSQSYGDTYSVTIDTVVNPGPGTYPNNLFSVASSSDTAALNPATNVVIAASSTTLSTPTAVTGGVSDAASSTPTANADVTFTTPTGTSTYSVNTYDVSTGAPVFVLSTAINGGSATVADTSYTTVVPGLTIGDSYEFLVTNGTNTSAYSTSVAMTTALRQPTAVGAGSGAINVTFYGDNAATTYTVNTYVYNTSTGATSAAPNTCAYQNTATLLGNGVAQTCTVTGLTNGNSYVFTVTPTGGNTISTVSAASSPAVQAAAILGAPTATAAGAVTANSVTTYNVNVSWTADGIATLYTVQAYNSTPALVSGATCTVANTTTPPTGAQTCTVTGLANGTYTFTVTPSGNNDSTAPATSNSVATSSALSTPTAAVSGPGTMKVSFTADGVATLYTVTEYAGGTVTSGVISSPTATVNSACFVANATTPPTGAQSCTVSGLTTGVKYSFLVTPSGGGTASTASLVSDQVTAASALATPTVANAGAKSVTVTFTADGNATLYTVQAYIMPADTAVSGATCTVANTTTAPTGTQSCTVTGLLNAQTYRFNVTPTYPANFSGATSSPSAQSVGITTVSPIVITGVAGAGSGAVKVTFTPDGVATTYLVHSYVGTSTTAAAQTCSVVSATAIATSPDQSCIVTGLSNGTAYTFTVTPSGNSTTSVMSAPSAEVTPGSGLATPTAVASGSGQATVSFVADGVATLYTVQSTGTQVTGFPVPANSSCVVANTATPPTGTQSCTVTGLTNGDTYTFTVTPSGNNTTSATSAPSVAITVTNKLATPTVKNAGSGAILVSFMADGVASTYTVNAFLNGAGNSVGSCVVANTTTAPTGAQSCTVTGLTNGASYTFTVTPTGNSTNSAPSLASSSIMVGTTFLATPTVTWGGSGAATVSFTADGVASTYVVTASTTSTATGIVTTGSCTVANSTTAPKGSQSCTVSGLSNGTTYTFVVTPSGNGTTSLPSAPSAAFTVTASVAPAAVTAVTTKATANSITVSWTAPTNTGNSALTGYVVTATAGNTTTSCGTVAGTATSCTISGLSASTVYVVSVAAVNAIGTSAAATASATTLAAPAAKNPFTHGVHGVAYVGRTVTLTILGGNFYGQPKITSNNAGTRVGVKGDTGTLLTIIVTTSASSHKGWHTFTITLANGKVCRANYNVK